MIEDGDALPYPGLPPSRTYERRRLHTRLPGTSRTTQAGPANWPASTSINSLKEFAPLAVVPRNHTRHRLLVGYRLTHPDRNLPGRSEPTAPGGVVNLNIDRLHALQVCSLEDPQELLRRGPAQATGEDVGHRFALSPITLGVHEQNHRSRGTRARRRGSGSRAPPSCRPDPRHPPVPPRRSTTARRGTLRTLTVCPGLPPIRRHGQIASQLHASR